MFQLNTFSIAARCSRTGMLGVAVSTAVPAVGGICSYIKEGVGAIATQSWVNPYLGIDGLKLLEQGLSAEDTLTKLLADDPGRDDRQMGIADAQGRVAAFTGASCVTYAGHILGNGFTVQGNMLVGAETINAMAAAANASEASDLTERLMLVLEAGQAAGGDKRGKQSAALRIHGDEDYAELDLRVDDHAEPIAELQRLYEVSLQRFQPFVGCLAGRHNPTGELDRARIEARVEEFHAQRRRVQ